jgi:cardiolipin synthase
MFARSRSRWSKKRVVWVAVATALLTTLVALGALNLKGPEKRIEEPVAHHAGVASPLFVRELSALLGPAIVAGNRIENLENGDAIFAAMLKDIAGARHSITMETFIYWSGKVGQRFADALSERARAGVRTHLLIDWIGSDQMKDELVDGMKNAGVHIEYYRPLRWYHVARMNHRTHRKLLIVDGRVGFTGGVGIADPWQGHAQDADHWRDSHYRVEGPVVAQMQGTFVDNWVKTTGEVLHGDKYFPVLEPTGEMPAQLFKSSPTGGADSMQLMYLLAISAAESSIDIANAYFVPDEAVQKALAAALRRGVKVRILVPGRHIDQKLVRHASRASWGELLEAGAAIHEFEPTMFHVKGMIIDRHLLSVGSTNFDNRSFRLNDECNLNVYDRAFAARATEVFEADLKRARRIELQAWRDRPFMERASEWFASLFSSQL